MKPTNRTNTVIIHRSMEEELKCLNRGKVFVGHVAYTFGTVQNAARWILSKEGQRAMRNHGTEVRWAIGDGSGDWIRQGWYNLVTPEGRQKLIEDAVDVSESESEAALDRAYLDHWNAVANYHPNGK